jgi:hypothetical protein
VAQKKNLYMKSYTRIIGVAFLALMGYVWVPAWLTGASVPEWWTSEVTIQVSDLVTYCLVGLLFVFCNAFVREKRGQYWRIHRFFKPDLPIRGEDQW